MAELVGGAFLSASLQVAFEKLASSELFDFFRRRKLNDGLLKKLHVILISVNQVIEDAEERQYRNPNVKKWLDELKDEVFNAEDLLDDIDIEATQQKLQAESQTFTNKVRGFLTPSVSSFDKEIEPRIQKVLDSLEYLIKQNEILGLKARLDVGTELRVDKKLYNRLPSLIDESSICGRDYEKKIIISMLSSHDNGNNPPFNVISITGLGGMGKTTLARLVYDDERMKDQFQLRAWLTISEEFDVLLVTKRILQELGCSTEGSYDCQHKLKDTLAGKKFLLVLDDVWNENRPNWNKFQAPFKYGAAGSKILVTTRSEIVANVMDSTHVHHLKQLQDEYCWELFAKLAFNDQHNGVDPELESIGRGIVEKCGGMPLAIKTLGSLLHKKRSPQQWKRILKSDLWDLSEDDSNIIPSLRLSYHYLPSNLKRCFAYCSIFPKDYEIDKDLLIQLWMAEGLLHSNQRGRSTDEVGNEFFNDLESRAFFEPSKSGNMCFVMHDLVNDLAQSVMGEFYLWPKDNWAQDISVKTRYFSYLKSNDVTYNDFDAMLSIRHQLRSFMSFHGDMYLYSSSIVVKALLSTQGHLKYVRALSLKGERNFKRLPNGIGNLKHLRYLDLSDTRIGKLPNSICLLINLQTLKLKGCHGMTKLPSNFHKLINLCHLDLEGSSIMKAPKYMRKLKSLAIRSTEIVVEDARGSNLKELGTLKYLRGRLIISKLENIVDLTYVKEVDIKDMIHLDKLELKWGLITNGEVSCQQEHLLDALQPNHDVKKLSVEGYGGRRFSDWMNGLDFVVSLKLINCRSCDSLPPLGQLPLLEKLEIGGFDGIKVIGAEFYGNYNTSSSSSSSYAPFRSLLRLSIWDMKEWEEWNICYEGRSFPRLQQLYIRDCPKLRKSLPQQLPFLRSLRIGGCPKLIGSWKDWGVHNLLSLEHIEVGDDDDIENVESFPAAPNLRSICFVKCSKLKAINYMALRDLRYLQYLRFEDCPLMSFENFPDDEQASPISLSELHIGGNCPLLKQRCRKYKGQDWPKVSHIPGIRIL